MRSPEEVLRRLQQSEQALAAAQCQLQEREEQLRQTCQELEETEREHQRRRKRNQRKRPHLPPVQLEKRTEILEPANKFCPRTGQARPRIGQEIATEYEFEPARLIIKEIVRPKYGQCGKDCCGGVAVAPLPPRLLPQSKLGLGLAVFLLLSRFDDHIAYSTLEPNFRERFGVVISRQQIVQWVEKIAHLLLAIYWAIWDELKAGNYLQIDETPVSVLDPEVRGKAATGYLWFYNLVENDVRPPAGGSPRRQPSTRRPLGGSPLLSSRGSAAPDANPAAPRAEDLTERGPSDQISAV